MKITLAQCNPTIADFEGNLEEIKKAINHAKKDKSDLIIFPELFSTGYPPQDLLFDHHFLNLHKKFITQLFQLSQSCKNIALLIGYVEETNSQLFNSALFLFEGKQLFNKRKTLLPNNDIFDEKRYFSENTQHETFSFKNETLGITICEDLWTTEDHLSPIPHLIKKNASILINISASPFEEKKVEKRLQKAKRITKKYKLPLVCVNQVGTNDAIIFDGHSFYMNQDQECHTLLPGFQSAIKTINLKTKPTQLPCLHFSAMDNLEAALTLGIQDYFKKTGFSKAVIGISGGIDSALTYVLCCLALTKEAIIPCMLPSPYTSKESIEDAEKLVGKNLHSLSITPLYEQFKETLNETINQTKITLTQENIQARIRGTLLMALANENNALVVSTGNKSELCLGYTTLYGDLCGALSPIGDLSKTQVYALATQLNKKYPNCIPNRILNKAPSAELRPNQKDQDSLPSYNEIDKQLEDLVETRQTDRTSDPFLIVKTQQSEYKRQQAPLILRVSSKAFGSGRRIPIAKKTY
ncbi:MAG: NAD+ synthase [bacterium]